MRHFRTGIVPSPRSRPLILNGDRNEKGVSLIEILVAIAIFSIGSLAVVKMQTAAMRANTFSANLTQAGIDLNQKKAEDLLALDYNDSTISSGVTHGPEVSGIFSTTWVATDNSPYLGAKTIVITPSWSDQSGNHTVTTTVVKSHFI